MRPMQLERLLHAQGFGSRKECRALIRAGYVSIAGEPCDDPNAEFDPASLPPVESLTAESDFTAFLRKEVPEALKRAALRKAWALDPAIRDFVGPADYAWDYNAPDGVPGFALELGGDVRKLLAQAIGLERDEEAAEAARLAAAARQPPATEDGASTPEAEAAPAPSATPADAPAVALASPDPAPEAKATPGATPRRHGSALPS